MCEYMGRLFWNYRTIQLFTQKRVKTGDKDYKADVNRQRQQPDIYDKECNKCSMGSKESTEMILKANLKVAVMAGGARDAAAVAQQTQRSPEACASI